MQRPNSQSGNIIFIIMIAIALFAALAFTITKGTRGNNSIDRETAVIAADAILSEARTMETAVQNLLNTNVEIADISFENSTVAGYAHSPVVSSDKRVFNSDGGGATYRAPNAAWLNSSWSAMAGYGTWVFPRNVCVADIGSGTEGTNKCYNDSIDNNELLVVLPFVKKEICMEINLKMGLTTAANASTIPVDDVCPWWLDAAPLKYVGVFDNDQHAFREFSAGDTVKVNGHPTGCFKISTSPGDCAAHSGTEKYFFYHVLIAR